MVVLRADSPENTALSFCRRTAQHAFIPDAEIPKVRGGIRKDRVVAMQKYKPTFCL